MFFLSYSEPSLVQRITSIVYRLQISFGPTQVSCWTGETRLELVFRPARSVSDSTLERRIASLGTLFGLVTLPAETRGLRKENRRAMNRVKNDNSMIAISIRLHSWSLKLGGSSQCTSMNRDNRLITHGILGTE